VVDDLAGEQRTDDVDALAQPRVADPLVRPWPAGDVLVRVLAGAERDLQAPRVQLAQRRRGLRDDRRVVALPGRGDDAVRQRGRLQRRAEPRPANPDSPWRALQGEKWSDDQARSNPAASAARIAASSRPGAICSCEAWMPIAVIRSGLPVAFRRMPAYVIASMSEAHNQEALAEYRRRNTDVVAAHGGRFIVRGGAHETLEGGWQPVRLVVIEFPTAAAARDWYESEDYAPLRELRQSASDTDIVLVEGV
jgi:uncharacterized protein (DUF1330 family)